jgi:hypothetical protein
MLSRLKFEIEPLAVEILDQLPASVWTSASTTFFDPAIGGGQFVREIEQRLRDHGHSDSNIRTRVFGFEESDLHIRFAVNKYNLVGQYARKPYEKLFELEDTMKFDVVVGNPPYQSGSDSKGNKLWPKFIFKSTELTKDHGYTCLVSPTGWSSGGTNIPGGRGVIKDIFAKYQVKSINVDNITKKYFPQISIEIGYVIINKTPVTATTPIRLQDGVTDVDFAKIDFLSPRLNKIDISIVNKVFFNNHPSYDVVSFDRSISRGSIVESSTKTKEFKFQHWVLGGTTANNAVMTWLNFENSPRLKYPKVVFNIGNRYWQPYYDLAGVNLAAQGFAIELTGKEDVLDLKSVFESKLFSYISWWYQLQMKGFMKTNIVKAYPKLDLMRQWTDVEIYDYFGLNEEERNQIETVLGSTKYN